MKARIKRKIQKRPFLYNVGQVFKACDWITSIQRGFNPHTHAGCDFLHGGNLASRRSFNPHTHAGCDNRYKCNYTRRRVSIHTPTQGVTQDKRQCKECLRVSIHTPTQGVTYQPLNYLYYYHCFNPHTHAGCDLLAGCCVSF